MFILTEKPSVAKEFAHALGGFTYHKGYYSNANDCITHAVGHVLSLFDPEDYDISLKKWDMHNLPIIPSNMQYKEIGETKDQLKIIAQCFKNFDSSDFILATDAEREGEFIGALILDYVGFKNYKTARRFWVSSALTKEVILNGIKNAKPLSEYEMYKKAGYARQQADWLTGINITRLLSIKANTFLSFGRVQTAILSAIYARDKNIENFKPKPYNQFEVNVGDFSLWLNDENDDIKLAQGCALLLQAENTIIKNTSVFIKDVQTDNKKELPPKLFSLTALQKHCSQKFKYSPKQTLQIAQSLYEDKKCLSYPRTPSSVLGDDNVELFKEKFELLSKEYTELAIDCVQENISAQNKRIFNSAKLVDHHALIPLSVLPSDVSEEQKNVYMAVLQRFFSTIKKEHTYNMIRIKADAKGFLLSANLKMITQEGWKKGIADEEESSEKAQRCAFSSVPSIAQEYKVLATKKHEKFTKPKNHFTESAILSLMENPRGENDEGKLVSLGTPATRAGIIDTLLKRSYVTKQKQNLLISDKGKFLIESVIKIPQLCSFVSLSTTTQWEEKLQTNPSDFLSQIKDFLITSFPEIKTLKQSQWENKGLGKCPLCSATVFEGKKNYFCANYKTCDFTVWKQICNANISTSDITSLTEGGSTRLKKMKKKDGTEFSAKLKYNKKEKKIDFVFNKK